MRIFHSHRLRRQTIQTAQRANMRHREDAFVVQQNMTDIFTAYLEKKSPEKRLRKAQALLNHHPTNRTRAEKASFTSSLFGVCAQGNPRFAAAEPLAHFCDMARSLARNQAIADCRHDGTGVDAMALEKAYMAVFERERVYEALTFHLAHTLSLEDMNLHIERFTSPAVTAARQEVAKALSDTPEAEPLGIDLVGRSLAHAALEGALAGPAEDIDPEIRQLLEAAGSSPVSTAGTYALCRSLSRASRDLLLELYQAPPLQMLLQACDRFIAALPGVHLPALDAGLDDAFREHMPAEKN